MASLEEIVGSFTPLMRSGDEWLGQCPVAEHAEPMAVIGERFQCYGCGLNGDALEFLRAVGEPDPEAALANGRIWQPVLNVPPKPHGPYSVVRIADHPGKTVLITDSRAAAKKADEILTSYVVVNWTDHGARWHGLEPLKGRTVLLWPSVHGVEAMGRLERVLADPRGLGCAGKALTEGLDLSEWQGTASELITWAKAHNRPLQNPVRQEVAGGGAMPPSEATTAAQNAVKDEPGNAVPPAQAAPALTGPIAKPVKRRLRVAGGTDVAMPDEETAPIPLELSESGISAHFVMLHRDKFRTVHEWAGKHGPCWMTWDGTRWKRESNRVTAMQEAQILSHGIKHWQAARTLTEPSKMRFESKKFIGAFLDLAGYAPEFVTDAGAFDADKMLLGTPGGTVDLTTGKLIEAEREHYITRQTTVTPEKGPHPLFDNVIERMCVGDDSLREYIWRSLGYSLTADQREEVFWFLHGKPQSGKSTLIKTIAEILGNAEEGGYSATFDMELFTEQRNDRGSERLAHLHGARFAWASETEEGKHFKAALLKLATGGDKLSGRFLYQEKFSFEPTHHLWIFGNERIHLKSADAGLKRRLHMLEYPGVIAEDERDNTLKERLKAEYPQILYSMIQGCLDWQMCHGLGKPEQISDAVDKYMDSEDDFGAWLEECTERGTTRVPIGEAFRSFTDWAEKNGAYAISSKRFAGEMEKRGFERTRSSGIRYVVGLSIKLGSSLP